MTLYDDHMTLIKLNFVHNIEESLGLRLKELGELKDQYYTDYQHHCKRR